MNIQYSVANRVVCLIYPSIIVFYQSLITSFTYCSFLHDWSELITVDVHMIKVKLFEDEIRSRLHLFFQHSANVSMYDPRNLALENE